MPRGKGIYEDERREHLENARFSEDEPEADETSDGATAEHTTEPPD